MLSPSVAMTSAHCIERGPGLPHIYGISFRNYKNQDYNNHTDEYFNCPAIPFYSLQASDSDIMLLECNPNAQGVLPGDKYGFIDTFNATDIDEGTSVASFWRNDVVEDGQDGRTVLYSWGNITWNINDIDWEAVSCETDIEHWCISSDLYTNSGASGAVWIYSSLGYRTLSGPTSTGGNEDYVRTSTVLGNVLWGDGDDFPWVEEYINQDTSNPYYPNPWKCNSALRVHKMDQNDDGMFDAIAEIDDNLAPRDVYALNLDARHRRLMWKTYYPSPYFDWIWQGQGYPYWVSAALRPGTGWTGWTYFLRRDLPLSPNNKYHVRVEFKRDNPSRNDLDLGVYFYGSGCSHNSFKTKHYNYATEPIDPKMFTFEIDTTGCTGNPRLYIYALDDIGVIVDRVTVALKNAYWDFDYWDTREDWRKDNDEGHALITPDGLNNSWAAVPYGVAGTQWNENCMNRAIPLLPNTYYAIQFKEKRKAYYGNKAYVLVRSKTAFSAGENNVLYSEFTPTSGSYGYRIAYFHTNNYEDYYVSFGQKYQGEYYVDYVRLYKYD
jgi:hypothetical protein